jgi:hypothetical protein
MVSAGCPRTQLKLPAYCQARQQRSQGLRCARVHEDPTQPGGAAPQCPERSACALPHPLHCRQGVVPGCRQWFFLCHAGAMQPTCESMAAIMADPVLLSGFDDPDVMAAVAEIAGCPAALQKHADNAKVCHLARTFIACCCLLSIADVSVGATDRCMWCPGCSLLRTDGTLCDKADEAETPRTVISAEARRPPTAKLEILVASKT